jgi:hypothetical protein
VKNKPNRTVVSQREEAALDFRAYIGTALHNLGLLHFLTGEFEDALSFFMRARDSRKGLLGESHEDYLVGTLLEPPRYAAGPISNAYLPALRLLTPKLRFATMPWKISTHPMLNLRLLLV